MDEVAIVHIILLDAVRRAERGHQAPVYDLLHRETWSVNVGSLSVHTMELSSAFGFSFEL